MKNKLSIAIITKNEEDNIVECLKNAEFADEIIIVDNDSQDKTLALTQKFSPKAKVYTQKFIDFSKQRSFARQKTTGDWLFYLDADERITDELKKEIIKTINSEKHASAYKIRRQNFYFRVYKWPKTEEIVRLIFTNKLKGWFGPIHESPLIEGEIGELKNYLNHFTHKNLQSMVKKTNQWSEIEAELLFRSQHPPMVWWRFLRIMLTKFTDSYFKQQGYKIGTAGFVESLYQAFSYFVVYAKLWEKQKK